MHSIRGLKFLRWFTHAGAIPLNNEG